MRQLGMVGTTFRLSGQGELERYTFSPEQLESGIRDLHEKCGFLESVYIATCNRVEIIFLGDPETAVAEYRRRIFEFFCPGTEDASLRASRALHAYEGEGAAERLFCVAAALDSMNPGDAQVLGQVKEAYRRSCEQDLVGKRLTLVFDQAMQAAKRVRTDTALGNGVVSMLSLALGRIEERLAGGTGRMAVIGVGDMAHQCGSSFGHRGEVEIFFVNRTFERAQELAKQYGGSAVSLQEFLERPEAVDIIVTATGAPEPILGEAFFAALSTRSPLVIDLAVPRDTDMEAARRHDVDLYDIDGLEAIAARNRERREVDVAEARQLVDDALTTLRTEVVEKEMGLILRALREYYTETARTNLDKLLNDSLSDLSKKERKAIERWANVFVNRCIHIPTVGLKHLAHEHGLEAVESFLAGLGEGFLDREDGERS